MRTIAILMLLAMPAFAQELPAKITEGGARCNWYFAQDLSTPPRADVPAGEFSIFVARSTLAAAFPNIEAWAENGCTLYLLNIEGAHGALRIKLVPNDVQYPSEAFAENPT